MKKEKKTAHLTKSNNQPQEPVVKRRNNTRYLEIPLGKSNANVQYVLEGEEARSYWRTLRIKNLDCGTSPAQLLTLLARENCKLADLQIHVRGGKISGPVEALVTIASEDVPFATFQLDERWPGEALEIEEVK